LGLIASVARPGGNVTGHTDEVAPLSAKRIELLKDVLPTASRIAVVWNATDDAMTLRYRGIQHAAKALHIDGVHLNDRGCAVMAAAVTAHLRYDPKLPDTGWKDWVKDYAVGKDVAWQDGKRTLPFDGNRLDVIFADDAPQPEHYSGLAETVLAERQQLAQSHKIAIKTSLAGAATTGEATLLKLLVANLLDNALRPHVTHGSVRIATPPASSRSASVSPSRSRSACSPASSSWRNGSSRTI